MKAASDVQDTRTGGKRTSNSEVIAVGSPEVESPVPWPLLRPAAANILPNSG